jgi:sugar-specific transcriptional regulator TrmB
MNDGLKLLGLSNNEIQVYLVLLKSGSLTGTEIRNKTNLANSRVYSSIDSLTNKGLVTYEKRARGKIYSAVDPEVIESLQKEREAKIKKCIPFLKQIKNNEIRATETAVFEGFQGFKHAFYKFSEECPINEEVFIIGFSNQTYKNEQLANLLRDVNKISIKKKHKFRMILDNKENKFYERRSKEGISKIRFMGNGFISPAAIDIFGDTVYMFMWDENPYVFRIKNKNIAQGFKVYFEFLWKQAKP